MCASLLLKTPLPKSPSGPYQSRVTLSGSQVKGGEAVRGGHLQGRLPLKERRSQAMVSLGRCPVLRIG